MVGRLVQKQDVGLLHAQPCEDQPGSLASRERTQLLPRVVAGEQHPPQLAPDEPDGLAGTESSEPVLGGPVGIAQLLAVVLREVTGLGLVAPLCLAGVGCEVSHQDLEEGRLPNAIGPDDGQPVTPAHIEIYAVQYFPAAK